MLVEYFSISIIDKLNNIDNGQTRTGTQSLIKNEGKLSDPVVSLGFIFFKALST